MGGFVMEGTLTFFVLAFVAFVGFVIYFIFKILQFVLTATNLYKKMISRQEAIMKLLMDIRDHTKQFKKTSIIDDVDDDSEVSGRENSKYVCDTCGAKVPVGEVCSNIRCSKPASVVTEPDYDYTCGDCGAKIGAEDNKCSKCGAEVES